MKNVKKSLLKKVSSALVVAMVFSIISIMSVVNVSATAIGENFLAGKDPGFEIGAWTSGMLTTTAHTGASAMQLGDAETQGNTNVWLNESFKPSTQYKLSYYLQTMADDNQNNKIFVAVRINAGGAPVTVGNSTDFFGNIPTFALREFTFNTPANLDAKVDAYNGFGLQIWSFKGILVDDASLVEIGPAPTPSPTPTPAPKASSVTINTVTDKTLKLTGKTTPVLSQFTLKYGTTTKTIKSNASGVWTSTLSKALAVGTKITRTGTTSKVSYVGATTPTVNSVTSKSKAITGKTYKKGVVTIKIGAKSYTVKASASTGAFKLALAKTLKKGSKFTVKVKFNGQTSPTKTYTVK